MHVEIEDKVDSVTVMIVVCLQILKIKELDWIVVDEVKNNAKMTSFSRWRRN